MLRRQPGLPARLRGALRAPAKKQELLHRDRARQLGLRPETHAPARCVMTEHLRLRFLPEVVGGFRALIDRKERLQRGRGRGPGRARPPRRSRRSPPTLGTLLGTPGRARAEGPSRPAGRLRGQGRQPGLRRFPRRTSSAASRRAGEQQLGDEACRSRLTRSPTSCAARSRGSRPPWTWPRWAPWCRVGDGIARVFGLDHVMAGELIEFPHDVFGLALNLEEDSVGCVLLGETYVHQGGRRGAPHRQDPLGAGRPGADRPGRRRPRPARSTARARSPPTTSQPDRAHRPRRRRAASR